MTSGRAKWLQEQNWIVPVSETARQRPRHPTKRRQVYPVTHRNWGDGTHPTPAKDKVVAFIEKSLATGFSPRLEDIRQHMGWTYVNSVKQCLRDIILLGRMPEGFDRRELERRR